MGRWRMVRRSEGAEGEDRVGKGEVGLDLDICPGPAEFLVTPLCRERLAATAARRVGGRVTTGRRLNGAGAVNRRRHLNG